MLVQKLRLQKGWTQEQLALVSGVSARTIQRLERGEPASIETLKSLAAVFDVDFQSLKEPIMTTEQTSAAPAEADVAFSPRTAQTGSGPTPTMVEEMLAFEHVRNLRRFYFNGMTYLVIVPMLAVINGVVSPGYPWAIFPALFWGVGLAMHGIRVFGRGWLWGPAWEKRQVEKILGRSL